MTVRLAIFVAMVFAAGVCVGVAVSRPQTPVVAVPVAPERVVTTRSSGDCEAELEAAKVLLRAVDAAEHGVPVAFPEGLPEPLTPAAFEANVRRALAECPDVPLKLAFVDCAEFPCLAWFESLERDGVQRLRDCPFWAERYPNDWISSATGQLVVDGAGSRDYAALGELPEGPIAGDDAQNRSKRVGRRFEEGRERLMDVWGAREPTRREELVSAIALFEEAAAEGNESADEMVTMLKKELAALPEE